MTTRRILLVDDDRDLLVFCAQALAALPGAVGQQLQNTVRRCLVTASGPTLGLEDLHEEILGHDRD